MSLDTYCMSPYQEAFLHPSCPFKNVKFGYSAPKEQPALHKIPSMPLLHSKIPNNPHLRRKLAIRKDKYFTNLQAAGPDAVQILQNILKMRKVHIFKKFEFDPYLCDESGIKPLYKVLNHLKRVKEMTFILRRIDSRYETDNTFTILHKFIGLEKLKIDLLSSLQVDDAAYMKIVKTLHSKRSHLKSYDFNLNSLQNVDEIVLNNSLHSLDRMRCTENMTINIVKKQSCNNELPSHECFNLKPMKQVKNFALEFGISSDGWDASTSNHCPIVLVKSLGSAINPKKMSLKFMKAIFKQPVVDAIKSAMRKHDKLRDFTLDIIACEVEDDVAISAINFLTNLLQLEKLTFKFTQRPSESNLSGDTIIQMIDLLVKATHLKKFDLYLRNTFLMPGERKALDERLATLNDDIQYKHLERSLHVYKGNPFNMQKMFTACKNISNK